MYMYMSPKFHVDLNVDCSVYALLNTQSSNVYIPMNDTIVK